MAERAQPQMAGDEATTLHEFLDYFRATLVMKVDGLTDEQARRMSAPPSVLNLMGLVRHMADVERNWFRRVMIGEEAPPIFYSDEQPDGDMEPGEQDSLVAALEVFHREVTEARRITAGRSLDELAVVSRRTVRPNLRWIMVHMIEEYARHCGHADLLREAIDGQVGD